MADSPDIPFVPSSTDRLALMVEMASIKPGQKSMDLGAGDGRVVIAMAQAGAEAYGLEINSKLVNEARENIRKVGVNNKAFVRLGNFWDEDLSSYDVITVYGITSVMSRLEKKLQEELKNGAVVISNYFTFPNWTPEETREKVYLYRKN